MAAEAWRLLETHTVYPHTPKRHELALAPAREGWAFLASGRNRRGDCLLVALLRLKAFLHSLLSAGTLPGSLSYFCFLSDCLY